MKKRRFSIDDGETVRRHMPGNHAAHGCGGFSLNLPWQTQSPQKPITRPNLI